jgi:FtsP/CotA-like multicopper oxidase with cupredoxin domain
MAYTRLNIYNGLYAPFLIQNLTNPLGLPSGEFDVPLILTDRTYEANGSLVYDTINGKWIVEAFGDVIQVNGMPWPRF